MCDTVPQIGKVYFEKLNDNMRFEVVEKTLESWDDLWDDEAFGFYDNLESAKEIVEMDNKALNDDRAFAGICKDCGKKYFIEEDEFAWFRNRGFNTPKRCASCRERRQR